MAFVNLHAAIKFWQALPAILASMKVQSGAQKVMEASFDKDDLTKVGIAAANALKANIKVPDRSIRLDLPDYLTQEWIDDTVLQAHMVAPIWSDYALVRERPDIWGMAAYTASHVKDRFVLVADDSFVVASKDHVEMLVTATSVAGRDAVYYQISLHILAINFETYFYPMSFRDLAESYGLLSYPDSDLIDELGLWQTGMGAGAYIAHPDRTRPIFILRSPMNLPTWAKSYQRGAKSILTGFGPVIVNDLLFKTYRSHLADQKFGLIAIAPGGDVIAMERQDSMPPSNFPQLLGLCEITAPTSVEVGEVQVGRSALAAWKPAHSQSPDIDALRRMGKDFRDIWAGVFEKLSAPTAPLISDAEGTDAAAASSAQPELASPELKAPEPLALDSEGYPIDSSDLARWAEAELVDQLVIVPRARRALLKSRHPDPRRIAEALEILAGPKLRGYLGEAGTVPAFETGLLQLRLRDGFSNADRLKGQTGADYIIEHQGRRLLLERHLCSNSSGFNDPWMIRIYYIFDKLARKIVVGWLPSHLRTSQS